MNKSILLILEKYWPVIMLRHNDNEAFPIFMLLIWLLDILPLNYKHPTLKIIEK